MNNFVGCRVIELTDNDMGITFPMLVMYPTNTPEKCEKLGPYDINLSMNAAIKEGIFPLGMISHGAGGSHLVYRVLAHYLASNGFMVGIPEHPFNNRNNNSWENTLENLLNRPKHLKMAIDWFFNHEPFSKHLKPNAVSVIGHSMGGYTALALAGGKPTSFGREAPDGHEQAIHVMPDSRIKAVILLAPATVWFRFPGALSAVKIPILMLSAEKDEYTPLFHAKIVLEGVTDNTKIQHSVIKNAGHFSFLSPFPEAMTRATFPPSQDPSGFDRAEFQQELNVKILKFLLDNLEQQELMGI